MSNPPDPKHPSQHGPPQARPRPILSWRLRQWLSRLAARPAKRLDQDDWDLGNLREQRIGLAKWDAIGDFVLATTLMRLMHRKLQPGRVTLFCREPVTALAQSQFPEWQILTLPPRLNPLRRIYLQPAGRRLLTTQNPFDLMIDLRAMRDMGDSVQSSWIPARRKIGLVNQYALEDVRLAGEEQLYHRLYAAPTANESSSEVCQDIRNYRFLARLLFPEETTTNDLWPNLAVPEAARRDLADALAREHNVSGRFLLVCPGSLDPIKEYPPERLAEAIRQVWKSQPIPVLLAGSAADARTTQPLYAALAGGEAVHDLTGRFDLARHAALISLAEAVLCMDSGTAHMAGALNRPAVAILGGGQPGLFAPWSASRSFRWIQHRLPCYGCNWLCAYERPLCIEAIAPEVIAQNLLEIL